MFSDCFYNGENRAKDDVSIILSDFPLHKYTEMSRKKVDYGTEKNKECSIRK